MAVTTKASPATGKVEPEGENSLILPVVETNHGERIKLVFEWLPKYEGCDGLSYVFFITCLCAITRNIFQPCSIK